MTVRRPRFAEESAIAAVVDSFPVVKLECRRAVAALRLGNHAVALRLMKYLCLKHHNSEHSAFVHRVQATVCATASETTDDPIAKQMHMQNAIESARIAFDLSPDSIEFGHFYALLLFEAANDANDYEEVADQCERALRVENPEDPAEQSLQDGNEVNVSADHVRSEIVSLLQKSNMAYIAIWLKNLDDGIEIRTLLHETVSQ